MYEKLMKYVDYYFAKLNNIKNKFIVYVVSSDEEEDDDLTNVIHGYQPTSINNYLKDIEFRTPSLNEFSTEELFIIGNTSIMGYSILYNINTLLKYTYVSILFSAGLGLSFVTIGYLNHFFNVFTNQDKLLEEDLLEDEKYYNSIPFKYNELLNNHFD